MVTAGLTAAAPAQGEMQELRVVTRMRWRGLRIRSRHRARDIGGREIKARCVYLINGGTSSAHSRVLATARMPKTKLGLDLRHLLPPLAVSAAALRVRVRAISTRRRHENIETDDIGWHDRLDGDAGAASGRSRPRPVGISVALTCFVWPWPVRIRV
jgi:hypothetical protein